MAYLRDDFTSRENRDLMSVSSDVLFADPLGVRADRKQSPLDYGGITQPGPLHASRGSADAEFVYADRYGYSGSNLKGGAGYRRQLDEDEYTPKEHRSSQYAVPRDEMLDTRLEPEDYGVQLQETLGQFGSYLWSFVAGGRQCCSMRDRTRKEDVEAARRAAITGRPPPRGENGHAHADGYPDTPVAAREQAQASRRFYAPDEDDEGQAEEPPLLSSSAGRGSRAQGLDRGSAAGWGSTLDPSTLQPAPQGSLPPKSDTASTVPDKPSTSSMAASALRDDPFLTGRKLDAYTDRGPPSSVEPPRIEESPVSAKHVPGKGDPRPPEGSLPGKWEWPPWCLNFKSPNIEVWVFDDDDRVGRWVAAQPQSRVVDKTGRDAYLCAEYLWDGEYYVQDFGPQHVRKKGEIKTVFQALTQAEPYGSVELDATKVFKKKEEDDSLMDTKVFKGKKGRPGRDGGGGLGLLDED